MNDIQDSSKLYLNAYQHFDQGDFAQAQKLVDQCQLVSPPDSYWHFGSLGLKCWIANFIGDLSAVERNAQKLLRSNSGEDKPWFDGMALFNLGISLLQMGKTDQAKKHFQEASERYRAQSLHPGQPAEWNLVIHFFAAVSEWIAFGNSSSLTEFEFELNAWRYLSDEIKHIKNAIRLLRHYENGEMVKVEAEEAITKGASRTFFAMILLA